MREAEAQSRVVTSESTHSEEDRVRLESLRQGTVCWGHSLGAWGGTHLAGTLVGTHLEADGAVVHGRQDVVLGVIEMPSGTVSRHARLAGTFVGAHLHGECGRLEGQHQL